MSRKVLIIPEDQARSIALCHSTIVDFCQETNYDIQFSILCNESQLLASNYFPKKNFINYLTQIKKSDHEFDVTINLKDAKSESNPAIKYLSLQSHPSLNTIPRQYLYQKIFSDKLLSLKNRPRIENKSFTAVKENSGKEVTFFILSALVENERSFWKYNLELHAKLVHFNKINIISDNSELIKQRITNDIDRESLQKVCLISVYNSDQVATALENSFLYIGHSSSLDYVLVNQPTKTIILHQSNRDMAWNSFGLQTLHLIKNSAEALQPAVINYFYDYLIEDQDFAWFQAQLSKIQMTVQEEDWWLRSSQNNAQNLLNNMVHTYYCFYLLNLDFHFEAIEINKNIQKNLEQVSLVISHLNNLSLHFVERLKLYTEKKIDFKKIQKHFRETQDLSLKLLKNYPDLMQLYFLHISNALNSLHHTITPNEIVQETQGWYDFSLALNAISGLIESLLNHPINKSLQVSDT